MNFKQLYRFGLVVIIIATLGIAVAIIMSNVVNRANKISISVVASYYPLYDFAKNIGGDKIEVINITPNGSEPHDYEPTPQQLVDIQKSKVFIYNGATFESWTDNIIPEIKGTVVNASLGIELANGSYEHGDDEDEHEINERDNETSINTKDPHFWLDPILAKQMIINIRDGLIKASPEHTEYFTGQAESYIDKLSQLDQDFKSGLSNCKINSAITSHAAFGYLAKRYNLDIISIAGINPEEEPSAAKLAEITELVSIKGINYIFFENLVSPKLAETIASETGAKTAVLDPIEGVSTQDQNNGKDYISIQKQNLQNLRTALYCK
jgi:zinc transport system substrate-binding protein